MIRLGERPLGIVLVTGLVAINGLGSLIQAVLVAGPTASAIADAALSAIIGLGLLHRAYGIWELKHSAWLITVILLCIRAVLAAVTLLLRQGNPADWILLAIVVITILYLLHPSVRNLYPGGRARE